jgi:hypothetical protein
MGIMKLSLTSIKQYAIKTYVEVQVEHAPRIRNLSSITRFLLPSFYDVYRSMDSVVGIATSYGMDDRGVGVRVPVGSRIFSSPNCPDRLCGPPNLLSNACPGLFPRGESGRGVKLTTHLQLVPRSRKCGSIHPLPHTPSWRSA